MAILETALKEWAVAVDALYRGETILLLRKGGIREQQGRFTVPQSRVLLFPTDEHQQVHLLKAPYGERVQPRSERAQEVIFRAWADITDVVQVTEPGRVQALLPFHIWTETWVTERLGWKPDLPLYVLLLRVYQLANPVVIPYEKSYGGCRSWISLTEAIDGAGAMPVLSDREYELRSQPIHTQLHSP